MMKVFLIMTLLAFSAMAAECPASVLAEGLEMERLEESIAVTEEDISYCSNLSEAGESCCSISAIESIQDKINDIIDQMEELMILRDEETAGAFTKIKEKFQETQEVMKEAGESVAELNEDVQEEFESEIEDLEEKFDEEFGEVKDIKKDFRDMQKERVKCLRTLLDLQASAYCTVCQLDINEVTEADGSLVPSQNVCARLRNGCFKFMKVAVKSSKAVELGQFAEELGEGVENMKKVLPNLKELVGKAKGLKKDMPGNGNGNGNGKGKGKKLEGGEDGELPPPPEGGENGDYSPFKDAFGDVDVGDEDLGEFENFRVPKFTFSGSVDNSGKPQKKRVGKPEGCEEEEDCVWICSNFIENGVIQIEKAVLGGEPEDTTEFDEDLAETVNMDTLGLSDDEGRRLQSRNLGKRVLSSGNWEAEEGMSGVETEVDEDPSGAGAEVEEDLANEEEDENASAAKIFSSIFATLSVFCVMLIAF